MLGNSRVAAGLASPQQGLSSVSKLYHTKLNNENLVMLNMYIQYTSSYMVSKHTKLLCKQKSFKEDLLFLWSYWNINVHSPATVQIVQPPLAVPSIILLHAGVIRTDDNLWSCYSISFTHQSAMSSRMTIMEELKWKHVVLTSYWISVWVFLLPLEDSRNQHDPFPIHQTTGNLLYC
jgi:hypothetical protein